MKQATGNFDGINGCQLYYKAWMPGAKPKATLAIVHGAGEHIERYKNPIDALLPSGYAVVGYDQRGHGQSGGRRGINRMKKLSC
jgi:alpha-beta hydrolase superfamily lysophospholipase